MSALPFVASFAQLGATILIEQTGLRKHQFIVFGVISRLFWLLMAAIPLMLVLPGRAETPGAAATVMLLAFASSFAAHMSMPAYMTWMGDLVPRRIRGRYFAQRNRIGVGVSVLLALLIGAVVDAVTVPGARELAAAQPMLLHVIMIILAIGAVAGVIDIVLYYRIREIVRTQPGAQNPPPVFKPVPHTGRGVRELLAYPVRYVRSMFRQILLEPLQDCTFRHYVGYGVTITFAMTVGGWFYWLNGMENLGISKLGMNVLFLGVAPVAGVLSARLWGRLMDRWGRRPVLIVSTLGTCFCLLPWFFAAPQTTNPQFPADAVNAISRGLGWGPWITSATPLGAYLLGMLAAVAGGIRWTGVALAQAGVILGFSDRSGRSKYVAASTVLISLGGALGGWVGGQVAQSLIFLQDSPILLGPRLWNNWHATIAISLIARWLSLLWLRHMPDPGAAPVRDMVRVFTTNVCAAVAPRLFQPLRIFGWGRRQNDHGKSRHH